MLPAVLLAVLLSAVLLAVLPPSEVPLSVLPEALVWYTWNTGMSYVGNLPRGISPFRSTGKGFVNAKAASRFFVTSSLYTAAVDTT